MVIRDARPDEYKKIAQLHEMVFPGFFMTSLGMDYLKGHYKAVLKYPDTICLVAENNEDICGFVIGRANAKNGLKKVIKAYPFHFAMLGLKLLFKKPSSLIRVVKNITKKRDDTTVRDDQNYSEIGLIGVLPETKGTGVGHKLFGAFCEKAVGKGAKRVSLTTDYYDNEWVLTSYRNWGFKEYYVFTAYPERKMYRLIKDFS